MSKTKVITSKKGEAPRISREWLDLESMIYRQADQPHLLQLHKF